MSNEEGQKYMTKKEAIVAVANEIIKQKGTATTLEILAVLEAAFPEEYWALSTVSSSMISVSEDYTVTKGYRGIFIYSAKLQAQEPKCINEARDYSIILEGETIYGSRTILTKIIIALNLPYRFSESSNEFQDITKIPFTHLVNIVAKDMEGMSKDELKAYMNTPLFRYYATKV